MLIPIGKLSNQIGIDDLVGNRKVTFKKEYLLDCNKANIFFALYYIQYLCN